MSVTRFILFMCLTSTLYALTLQEAINTSLKNHPNIKLFALKLQKTKIDKKYLEATNYPKLSLQASHAFNQTFLTPRQEIENLATSEVSIALNQKIYDFGQTSQKIQAQKFAIEENTVSLQEAKAYLIYEVKKIYKLLLLEKEAIKVRRKDLQTKKAYLDQAKALFHQGLKTPADISRFEAAYIEALDALQKEKAAFQKAKTTLSLYMGRPLPNNLVLEDKLLANTATLKKDIAKNFALQKAKLREKREKALFKAIKNKKFGTLNLQASFQRVDSLKTYNAKNIFLVYSLPLFDTPLQKEIQSAKVAIQEAKKQKELAALQAKDKIASLLIDIQSLKTTIEAKKAQIVWAKKSLEIMQARYKEGLANFTELLDSNSFYLHAKLSLLQALYQRSVLIDALEYEEGKL